MLKQTKKKCAKIQLRIGTFLQLPLADSSCDCIVTSYAFHHNDDASKKLAIQEMDRVLSAHGCIVITDLMFASLIKREEFEKECSDQQRLELEDEYFASVDEMEELFTMCGYHCESTQIDHFIWRITAKK